LVNINEHDYRILKIDSKTIAVRHSVHSKNTFYGIRELIEIHVPYFRLAKSKEIAEISSGIEEFVADGLPNDYNYKSNYQLNYGWIKKLDAQRKVNTVLTSDLSKEILAWRAAFIIP
jgi:hypothetical protein